jgi:hypothetical protein
MAMAVHAQPLDSDRAKVRAEDEDGAPITLLLVRGPGDGSETSDLRVSLETIALRYAPHVVLQVVSQAEVPEPYRQRPMLGPAVLVLRRGELVGEAMGALPVRELDSVVRCAVEWPDV